MRNLLQRLFGKSSAAVPEVERARPSPVETSSPRPWTLEKSVSVHFAPSLRKLGFTGSGRSFRRVSGDLIHVVQLQGSRYGGQFAVNLGLQPLGIFDVSGRLPDPRRVKDYECEFRQRLSESGSDQWWPHDDTKESMDAAVAEAARVYAQFGEDRFINQSSPGSPLFTVTAAQFERGEFNFSGFRSTRIRMTRTLAMMRFLAGQFDESKAFAQLGMDEASPTWSRLNDLADLVIGTWTPPAS